MSVVYPLTAPPQFCEQGVVVRPKNIVSTTNAPFSGAEQIQEWQGGTWEMEISFPPLAAQDGEPIVAFLEMLRGRFGTFLYAPSTKRRPSGAARLAPGDPVVYGALQTGLTLDVSTSLANVKAWLVSGDLVSLPYGNSVQLYRVTRDADLIAGKGRLNIWPRLRAIPNIGDPVTIIDPKGMFRLSIDDPQHEVDESGIYRIDTVPIREAFGQ